MADDGLSLVGMYTHFGEVAEMGEWKSVLIYQSPGGTLVVKTCDDPDGHMAMILSHMNGGELQVMMDCLGTDCDGFRRTA